MAKDPTPAPSSSSLSSGYDSERSSPSTPFDQRYSFIPTAIKQTTTSTSQAAAPDRVVSSLPQKFTNRGYLRFSSAQDVYVARLLAVPAVWRIIRGAFHGSKYFAPKKEVIIALDSIICRKFTLQGAPYKILANRWKSKLKSMWDCWNRADAVAKDLNNKGLSPRDIQVSVKDVCGYYYVVQDTWSQEASTSQPTMEDVRITLDEALCDLIKARNTLFLDQTQSSEPSRSQAENSVAEENSVEQSGAKNEETGHMEIEQRRTDQDMRIQDQGHQIDQGTVQSTRNPKRKKPTLIVSDTEDDEDFWGTAKIDITHESSQVVPREKAAVDQVKCEHELVEAAKDIALSTAGLTTTTEPDLKKRRLAVEQERQDIDHRKQDLHQNPSEPYMKTILREIKELERKTVWVYHEMELEAAKAAVEVSQIRLEHDCAKLELVKERQRYDTAKRNMQEVTARGSSNTAQSLVDDSHQDVKDRDKKWCEASVAYKDALERAAAGATSNDLALLEARNALEHTKLDLEESRLVP